MLSVAKHLFCIIGHFVKLRVTYSLRNKQPQRAQRTQRIVNYLSFEFFVAIKNLETNALRK